MIPEVAEQQLNDDSRATREEILERIRIQAAIGGSAMRTVVLVNGGAVIALLTFIGNTRTSGGLTLSLGLGCFLFGLALGLVAHAAAFMSQERFYRQTVAELQRIQQSQVDRQIHTNSNAELDLNASGSSWLNAAILLALGSVGLFIIGSVLSLAAIG